MDVERAKEEMSLEKIEYSERIWKKKIRKMMNHMLGILSWEKVYEVI